MKKNYSDWGELYYSLKKTLLIMRIAIVLLLVGFLQTHANDAYAQKTRLSVSFTNTQLAKVLDKIENESEFFFLYNEKLIDANRKVSIDAKDERIDEVLKTLFAGTDVEYTITDRKIILAPAFLSESQQQGKKVDGKVTDKSGASLPGATVVVKGTTTGVITDNDGKFSLALSAEAKVLVFSFVGMKTQEFAVEGKATFNVKLEEETVGIEEVVAIGYGTTRKSDLTGSVGLVKGSDMKSEGVSNVISSLQGKIAGVSIESATGKPGAETKVLIRGVGSFGNSAPLYLVDGIPVAGISNIPASDIETMNILKDASAAAIYGSRAANGVVLITTKNGSLGAPKIQFDATFGIQNIVKKWDVLNAEEWATVSNAAHDAAGLKRLDIANNPQSLGVGTNWQDAVFRTAPIQQYHLGVSGADEVVKYSLTGSYNSQQGTIETTGYERYNIRLKTEVTKGILKFGETLMVTNEDWRNVPSGWGSRADAVGAATIMIPAFKIYNQNAVGGYDGASGPVVNVGNPMAQLNLERNTTNMFGIINNTFAELTFFEDIKYKLNIGYTQNFNNNGKYTYKYDVGTLYTNPTNNLFESKGQSKTLLIENTVNYNKKIDKHNIQALLGYTYQTYEYKNSSISDTNLPDGIFVMSAARGEPNITGTKTQNALVSILGRAIYSYDERYLATATFRRDGSSRFGDAQRFGVFPSVALGWNVNNESFFKELFLNNVFSALKLRGSFGVLGNQEINDYLYAASITGNRNYPIGVGQVKWSGAIQTSFATPDIKWETTKTYNAGLDMSLLNNRFNLTFDWFNKKTNDILLNVPIPLSAGSSVNPTVNAGTISNKGVEFGFNYKGTSGKLHYNVFGTATHVVNKVIELGTGTQQIFGGVPMLHGANTTVAQAGGELGEFYLRKVVGVFQTDEEVKAYSKNGKLIQPYAKAGDLKYLDSNGDGTINDLDRVKCGSPFPKFEFGFGFNGNFNNFDLSIYLQGVAGNKIYNGMRQELEGMTLEQNYSKTTLNAWTPQNTNTNIPRAVINDPNYNSYSSSRFLENGSYLRLKTLQIGYKLPQTVLHSIHVQNLRLFISADNLITITKYTGYNPDLGGQSSNILDRGVDFSSGSYPLSRTISFGIQVTL